ncbi:MAG: beta-galactosidase, partial [Prevotella sp.]|nr:beta-galactosidase [Prevotella sp.]
FVRTEEHEHGHSGRLTVDGLSFDFLLEPFGSVVYYVRHGEQHGECFPKSLPQVRSPRGLPPVKITPSLVSEIPEVMPKRWTRLPEGQMLDDLGLYSRHPVWFRTQVAAGDTLHVGRIGKGVVNHTQADIVQLWIDDSLIVPVGSDAAEVRYIIPASKRRKVAAYILYYSLGLHHHTNLSVEQHWKIGLEYVRQAGRRLPLSFASAEGVQRVYAFDAPSTGAPVWLHFSDLADGFITVNGHSIGRMWAAGPQHDFYVPGCWINAGGTNRVVVSTIRNNHQ